MIISHGMIRSDPINSEHQKHTLANFWHNIHIPSVYAGIFVLFEKEEQKIVFDYWC